MFWKISLFAMALLSLCAPLGATVIYVSGDQTGTWSADTVIVTGEVRVPPGQSLTILPGVEVLFSVYCKLIVDSGATLRAVGTAADSIRFDVLPPNVNWHGIRFLSASDSSRLEYCVLTHGKATGVGEEAKGGALYCFSSSPILGHNSITGNQAGSHEDSGVGGGIYCGSNSNPNISENSISGNSAIELGGGWGGGIGCDLSSPTITGNIISGNQSFSGFGGGIACYNNSNPDIVGNTITENQVSFGGGISCQNSNPVIGGNTISRNSSGSAGGGIYCSNSSPIINGNSISENSNEGIYCTWYSSPTINGNIIIENSDSGISCGGGNPTISGNTITGNSATNFGGGILCNDAIITDNTISRNSAGSRGGGIYCSSSSAIIAGNTINGNSAGGYGGGICCYPSNPSPSISGNTISQNIANLGGGIYCFASSSDLSNNTISYNYSNDGGGIYCYTSYPTLVNCIIWGNTSIQISGGAEVIYSDIQGGYTGTGNINAWPAFVDTAQNDYRLQWGSPCIDTGDPNPLYNDPDGTRSDMGAWYYDQSLPVRVLLTPYNAPIQIPASGGSFQYAIQATNIESTTLPVLVWCNVTVPGMVLPYGPVLGPVTISLASGQTLSRVRTQVVPAGAPAGMYHYSAYAVAEGDTSEDSFIFVKLGDSGQAGMTLFSGWTNAGEAFDLAEVEGQLAAPMPEDVRIAVSPNPFNPTTALRYKLQAPSHVSLRIYDTAGRLVTTLADSWRDAGNHQITFDGSSLPSGIYFAKLTAGDYSQVQKLVLLK